MESARIMPSKLTFDAVCRPRTRSFGFLEYEGESWACYLVTYRTGQRRWCGYLTFRPDGERQMEEVRTADLFIESDEAEIGRRARGLGRPLLSGLLSSALEVERRPTGARLRDWVRGALESEFDGGSAPALSPDAEASLRSEYATYRLDQLIHLVSLIDDEQFEEVVSSLLDQESYSFRSRDRLQFAMLFVQKLEPLVPLPPFEVFAADLRTNPGTHRRYHHDLHAGNGHV